MESGGESADASDTVVLISEDVEAEAAANCVFNGGCSTVFRTGT